MFDPTLNGLMAQIQADKIVLPAMQRPFVWREQRITTLIDSMLRGFPLGTTLLWKTTTMQRYRRFKSNIQPNEGITTDFESDNSTERYLVLDGQQRLTSLYVALEGTYDNKRLYIDVLSGERGDKDPGEAYWDSRFLTEAEAKALNLWPRKSQTKGPVEERQVFIPLRELTSLAAARAAIVANRRAQELGLNETQATRMSTSYIQCATILASKTALQVHLIDENPGDPTPIEEILEIFVRVNSGGLTLQKSDLLMSLLDLRWNDIQPALHRVMLNVNRARPFRITRDDILKSLLIAKGSETRFDRLVADRDRVEALAVELPALLPAVEKAWQSLTLLLMDECKITSERLFRGGHNSLLPFVQYLSLNAAPAPAEKRRLVFALYCALMTGIFAGAEARMNAFVKKYVQKGKPFPVKELTKLVAKTYGVKSLSELLNRHLDLTLNITHGGITLDNNPENLQRDHIFPRSTLIKGGVTTEKANHYANFHFLRGSDNLNKSDMPPHLWFAAPGVGAPYTNEDLAERLLTWELLQPSQYDTLLVERTKSVHKRALDLFGFESEEHIDDLFAGEDTLLVQTPETSEVGT